MKSRQSFRAASSLTALVVASLAILAWPAEAQERLRFDDTSSLSVDVAKDGTATVTVVVLNDGPKASVSFAIVPTGDTTASMTVKADPADLKPFRATPVSLTISGIPTNSRVTGDLVVSGDKVGTAVRPISLALKSTRHYILLLTLVSFLSALFFVGLRARALQQSPETKFDWQTRLAPADWKFSDSWASNLTAGGAVLGTIVAGSVLPDNPHLLTKAQYGATNLYFGVLVVVAAYLYNAIVEKKEIAASAGPPPTPKKWQSEGFVWVYLLSSVLTLWAVWGEVGTLYVMMTDIVSSGRFASLSSLLLLVGSAVVVGVGGLYAWRTIGWNVLYYREQPPAPGVAAPPASEPLPRFSLL